tara:strand:- start:7933 stop:8427 length:495 start_codon:yes stop_codon:yes gene_type:complete
MSGVQNIIKRSGEDQGNLLQQQPVVVNLLFPYSSSPINPYTNTIDMKNMTGFKMSFNDALQSGFCAALLDELDDDLLYCDIVIPKGLYRGIRQKDLKYLYHLWIGETELAMFPDSQKYDLARIAKVSAALSLNQNLEFVKKLDEEYMHPEFKNMVSTSNNEDND